jgi:hypothetical protein
MYSDILNGLEKIRRDGQSLRNNWYRKPSGEILAVVLPSRANRILPTCYVINIATLLNEALEKYINTNFLVSRKVIGSLEQKINYLDKLAKLNSAGRLHEIRNKRNQYAHELESYSTWEEMDAILKDVEDELRNLGIL